MGELEFDLSRSLKVKSNGAIGLPTYDFLLMSNSKYMFNSHHLDTRAIFLKMKSLHPWVQGKPPIENKIDR